MNRRGGAGGFLVVNPRIQTELPSPGSGAASGGISIPKSFGSLGNSA